MENLADVKHQILEEWKRFRSVSIHNVDPCFKQSMLSKLFSSKGSSAAPVQASTSAETGSPTDGAASEISTPIKQNRSTIQQQTPTTPITPGRKHKSRFVNYSRSNLYSFFPSQCVLNSNLSSFLSHSKKKKDKKKRKRVVVSSDDDGDSSEDDDDEDYDEGY